MARSWRLTRQAEESLVEIARWTSQQFGPRQARAYELDLISLCHEIAEGTAHTRSCRDHINQVISPDLRFARIGGHLVIFIEMEAEVVITDFLHARRDLPYLLTGPGPDDS